MQQSAIHGGGDGRWWLLVAVLMMVSAAGAGTVADEDTGEQQCLQRSACKCLTSQGAGIDLQPLAAFKYLVAPQLPNNLTFYFHPCADVDMVISGADNKTTACPASTLCAFNRTDGSFVSLGKTADTEFHDSVTHDRFIVVKKPDKTTSLIQLACSNVEPDRLFGLPDADETAQYKLVLYSRLACMRSLEDDHSLSTGAILVIVFFTLCFSYLVLGMLINYFLVGARGIEMLPHLAFWRDFPALVREGVAFLQNGCNPTARDDLLNAPTTPNQDSYVSI